MSEHSNNAQAIIDNARLSAEPTLLADGKLAAFPVHVDIVDIEQRIASYAASPRRKVGQFAVHDADSFVDYLDKHGVPESEVWADTVAAKVVGVVNAHGEPGTTGWADHRVTYSVLTTDAWRAWIKYDGQLLDQSTFAEHIEDRAVDVIAPSAADLLELAQTFQANIGVRFESSKLLSSGERVLEYREQVDAKAGRAGKMEVPKDFELALIPFEGADRYKVTARFRYRISDGTLRIGYRLERPADVQREAFLGVLGSIEARVTAPVFRGVSA